MIINELLKKYDAKFTLDSNGEGNEINPNILKNAKVMKNDKNEFILHEDSDGLFELIVRPPNTIIYNYYDHDGELYMSHEYSDTIGIGN